MKKFILTLTIIGFIFGATSSICIADNISQIIGDGNTVIFSDVPTEHWAKNEIEYFAKKNIVNGNGDGTFEPDSGVTREQFCKMLILTFNATPNSPLSPSFSDVNSSKWSYPYIETCKDFMTGYVNPLGGLPAFHPEEYATREDIAVALVRIMGLTQKDVKDKDYVHRKFYDSDAISPELFDYVNIACERGLINGYPDETFKPNQGVTRAETVALLNRATKQAMAEVNAELELGTNVYYSDDGKTANIQIFADEGVNVTVDGESVSMNYNGYSGYEGTYRYNFDDEGTKTFVVHGEKLGKTKAVTVEAKYAIDAPVLSITNCPTTVSDKSVTIFGTLTDSKDDTLSLTINGESVYVDYYGDWSKSFTLDEGDNTFEFVASNSSGKTVEETKIIKFNVGGPNLTISTCPTTVTEKTATISGKLTDSNYDVALTINGESVSVDYYGDWSKTYTLKEGDNTFEFVASNSAGKTVKETKTIKFNVGGPKFTITKCPTTVTEKTATISGKLTDDNYNVSLTINGESVSVDYYGDWRKTFTLKEGDNTFEFVASNSAGKTVKETKTIKFNVGGPDFSITTCPTTVTEKTATISGKLTDDNYNVSLTINGESVSVDYYGNWSKSFTLEEGDNTFEFVASNSAGKTVTKTKTIKLKVSSPEIKFTNCPEETNKEKITIEGRIKNADNNTKLYVNDESLNINQNGDFRYTVYLDAGENKFNFRVINDYDKEDSVTKTITRIQDIAE